MMMKLVAFLLIVLTSIASATCTNADGTTKAKMPTKAEVRENMGKNIKAMETQKHFAKKAVFVKAQHKIQRKLDSEKRKGRRAAGVIVPLTPEEEEDADQNRLDAINKIDNTVITNPLYIAEAEAEERRKIIAEKKRKRNAEATSDKTKASRAKYEALLAKSAAKSSSSTSAGSKVSLEDRLKMDALSKVPKKTATVLALEARIVNLEARIVNLNARIVNLNKELENKRRKFSQQQSDLDNYKMYYKAVQNAKKNHPNKTKNFLKKLNDHYEQLRKKMLERITKRRNSKSRKSKSRKRSS